MSEDDKGARMVDVGGKPTTERRAVARGLIKLKPETLARIQDGTVPKGNVLEVARVAGIMAAKRTPEIVLLCHPISLTKITVSPRVIDRGVEITAEVCAMERTGVEMEALTAVSAAALAVYDMCKPIEPGAIIADIRLMEKSGGVHGDFAREEEI